MELVYIINATKDMQGLLSDNIVMDNSSLKKRDDKRTICGTDLITTKERNSSSGAS